MCVFLAVLLTVLSESESQLKKWVWIALGVGLFESILGLAQYGSGPSSLLRVGPGFGSISAVGTYTNRDHLAGLLEMLIPLSMAMMIASFRHDRAKDTLESFSHKLASLRFSGSFIYIAVFILTTLAIIFTQSRAGIFVMLLGTFLSLLIFGRRLGGGRAFGIGLTVLILLLMLAVGVGLMPVINRFILEDPMQDLRWPMAEALLTHLPSFLPWGSGLGTFGEVFERFQTEALNGFYIDHAHNDIFEFLFEGGVLAGLVLVLFVWAYIRQWRRFWPQNRWHRHDYIKAGAGVSILLMALHSFIDFNLHVPANLIYFALVIGLFFHEAHIKPQAS
jgi:O-antigen ligase